MSPGQKIATAVVVGIVVVLTGAYALIAMERSNGSLESESATDTQAVTPSETIASAMPLHIEATSPDMTTVTPRSSSARRASVTTTSNANVKTDAVMKAAPMIAAGTTVDVKIQTHVSSRNAKVGDRVEAVTINNVMMNDRIVIPAGTAVVGEVTEVRPAAETKSAAVLKIAFFKIGDHSTRLAVVTPDLAARARTANRAVDAGLVIGGAATGAVIGNQTDAKHGTEIGAVVGGVAGGIAAANIGANVQLKLGETATLKFTNDVM